MKMLSKEKQCKRIIICCNKLKCFMFNSEEIVYNITENYEFFLQTLYEVFYL